jgi:hypothetical protein
MYTNILAAIVLTVLLGIIFTIYFIPKKIVSKDILIMTLIILQIISLFFLYYTPYDESEKFYFEVSPERKKCLMEQVSLNIQPNHRSKNCCPADTVGGKLPTFTEWEHSDNPIHWDRTDNNTTSEDNNAFRTQLAPTSIIKD